MTPSISVLRKWPIEGMWDIYADDMDVKVAVITDTDLINKKAEMLRKHQADAAKVAEKALAQIIKEGFDSSAAAVHAYFKSTEEQRKTAGFSDLLEKLEKMTNNEVEQQIINLVNRASENDQIIDGESEDVTGEEDPA